MGDTNHMSNLMKWAKENVTVAAAELEAGELLNAKLALRLALDMIEALEAEKVA